MPRSQAEVTTDGTDFGGEDGSRWRGWGGVHPFSSVKSVEEKVLRARWQVMTAENTEAAEWIGGRIRCWSMPFLVGRTRACEQFSNTKIAERAERSGGAKHGAGALSSRGADRGRESAPRAHVARGDRGV